MPSPMPKVRLFPVPGLEWIDPQMWEHWHDTKRSATTVELLSLPQRTWLLIDCCESPLLIPLWSSSSEVIPRSCSAFSALRADMRVEGSPSHSFAHRSGCVPVFPLSLFNKHQIIVFTKGRPPEPQCLFLNERRKRHFHSHSLSAYDGRGT